MKLSNDVKWNKIKAIENKLIPIYAKCVQSNALKGKEIAHKIAKLKVWLLANEIYDIATEGLTSDRYGDSFPEHPEHWTSLLKRINRVGSSKYSEDKMKQKVIEEFWAEYDYTNS